MPGNPTLLPSGLQLLAAWEQALEALIAAARDSAEFADGVAIGRSRAVSLRKLRAAIQQIDHLASLNNQPLSKSIPYHSA